MKHLKKFVHFDQPQKIEESLIEDLRNYFGFSGRAIMKYMSQLENMMLKVLEDEQMETEVVEYNPEELYGLKHIEDLKIKNQLVDLFSLIDEYLDLEQNAKIDTLKRNLQSNIRNILEGESVDIKYEFTKRYLVQSLERKRRDLRTRKLPKFKIKNLAIQISKIIRTKDPEQPARAQSSRFRLRDWFERMKNELFQRYANYFDVEKIDTWLDLDEYGSVFRTSEAEPEPAEISPQVKFDSDKIKDLPTDQSFAFPSPGTYSIKFEDREYTIAYLGQIEDFELGTAITVFGKNQQEPNPDVKKKLSRFELALHRNVLLFWDSILNQFWIYDTTKNKEFYQQSQEKVKEHFEFVQKSRVLRPNISYEKISDRVRFDISEASSIWNERFHGALDFYPTFLASLKSMLGIESGPAGKKKISGIAQKIFFDVFENSKFKIDINDYAQEKSLEAVFLKIYLRYER